MCKFVLMKQVCPKGVECSYSHSLKYLDEVTPHFKSRMCSAIMKGHPCVKECTFAHTPEELVLRACQFGSECYNINPRPGARVCHFIHPGDTATTYPKRTGLKWPRDVVVPPQKNAKTRTEPRREERVVEVRPAAEPVMKERPKGTAQDLIEEILAAELAGVSLESKTNEPEWPALSSKKRESKEGPKEMVKEDSWADHVEKFAKALEEHAPKVESETDSVHSPKRTHSSFSSLSKEEAVEAREAELDREDATKRHKVAPEEPVKTPTQRVVVEFTPEQFALICAQLMQMRVSFRTVEA